MFIVILALIVRNDARTVKLFTISFLVINVTRVIV